jgi:tyrosine-protein phosphatase YwqE
MFGFLKKKPPGGPPLAALGCDMHSHLIPGIDDGAPDMDTTIRLIKGMAELGYKRLVTTPHINGDVYPNTIEIIRAGEAAVTEQLRKEGMGMGFRAAAEHLLDDHFTRALSAGEPFLTLKDNLLLVELSFAVPLINLKEIIFDIQLKGYIPVLAHPERYLYFAVNKGWYDQLRDAGCLFQLNLLSFAGYYGRDAQELAGWLVKKNYVEFLGSDLHHYRHLEMLRTSSRVSRLVQQLTDAGLLRNDTL